MESVWDYPRPPRLEAANKQIRIEFNGVVVAETNDAYRVLETSHPPVYYVPPSVVPTEYLVASARRSFCEWKGEAGYVTLRVDGKESIDAAWFYRKPTPAFAAIAGYYAFYPSRVDACFVDGVRVQAQAGNFYGGWITPDITGPFKGAPGSAGW